MAIGSAMRPNPVLWAVRVLQLLVCVSVLAFASINVNDYQSVPCSIPVRLQYNISAVSSLPSGLDRPFRLCPIRRKLTR